MVQTLFLLFVMGDATRMLLSTSNITLPVVMFLLGWPIIVTLLIHRPAISKRLQASELGEELVPRDLGIEGCGAVMTMLGIVGVIIGVAMTYSAFAGDVFRAGVIGLLAIGLIVSLLVRSILHVKAGLAGMRGAEALVFASSLSHYAIAAYVSTALFVAMSLLGIGHGAGMGPTLALVIGTGLLLVWPTLLRAYVNSSVLIQGAGRIQERAPDAGLTHVGYWLIAICTAQLPFLTMVLGGSSPEFAMGMGMGMTGTVAVALALITLAFGFWAGFACVTMNSYYKIAGTLYGATAIINSLTQWFEAGIFDLMGAGLGSMQVLLPMLLALGASLAIPIFIIVAVNRRLPEVRSLNELENVFR